MRDAVEVRRFALSSQDPDVFDGWVREMYVGFERRRWGDQRDGSYVFSGAAVPEFSIVTSAHGTGIEFVTEPLDDGVIVNVNRTGQFAVSSGPTTVEPEIGQLFLMPQAQPWRIHAVGFTNEPVHLTTPALRSAAAGLGWDGDDVRFTGCLPLPPRHAYLSATIAHVRDHVLNGLDPLPPLLVSEAGRALAMATLLTFPNTALDAYLERPTPGAPAEPAVVRRAVEFMDAHAREDIDIAQIADASRIGPRGLQAAFRRHRDQTPMEYLRQVRMAGTHRDLQAGDPTRGDTVAAVAARWGFTHPGRFSVEYRRTYGRSPSDTLRR